MWTHFWDMHSGGGRKEKWEHIFVELPQNQAEIFFQNRFGHNPNRISCTCCGSDYSISEGKDISQLTGYHRNCDYDTAKKKYINKPKYGDVVLTLKEFENSKNVKFIYKKDIKDEELKGELHKEGWVWQ